MRIKAICDGGCGREDMMALSTDRPDGWFLITIEGPADSATLRVKREGPTLCPDCFAKVLIPGYGALSLA